MLQKLFSELKYPQHLDQLINLYKYGIASWSYDKITQFEPLNFISSKASGHGGSETFRVFNDTFFTVPIMYFKQDITVIDIFSDLYTKFRLNKRIICIEDMNKLLGKRNSVVIPLFNSLLLITQKGGLTDIVSAGGYKQHLDPALEMSLYTCITPEVLNMNYFSWTISGLIDRDFLVTWCLSKSQQLEIARYNDRLSLKKQQDYKPQLLDYGIDRKLVIPREDIFEQLIKTSGLITKIYFDKFKNQTINKEMINFNLQINRTISKISKDSTFEEQLKLMQDNQKRKIEEELQKDIPSWLRKYDKLKLLTIGKVISEHRKEVTLEDVNFIDGLARRFFLLEYKELEDVENGYNKKTFEV